MTNCINIILLCILIYVLYIFIIKLNITESFGNLYNQKINKYDAPQNNDIFDNTYVSNFMDSINKKNKKKSKKNTEQNNKYFFKQEQFNNNYRDTLTAFNNIAPDQKTVFNTMNLPVSTITLPNTDTTAVSLIKNFVKQLNENIKTQITDKLNENSGWDEKVPEPNMKSGWDEAQTELGLPSSLFNGPAKKSPVKITEIKGVQRETTDAETRYRINVILKKRNTYDKIAVRLNFVTSNDDDEYNKRYIGDNDTKNTNINKSNNLVIIEEIAILGFFIYEPQLCDQIIDENKKNYDEDLFNFGDLNENNITDQTFIMKELTDNYKRRITEANGFNAALDTEGRNFNSSLIGTFS